MKKAIVILMIMLVAGYAQASKYSSSIDPKLIKEVKTELEKPMFVNVEVVEAPEVLVYSFDGRLLHSFKEGNVDPIAMRNVDFLMDYKSQKIFVKAKELKPSI